MPKGYYTSDKYKQYIKSYRAKNKDKIAKQVKTYQDKNIDSIKLYRTLKHDEIMAKSKASRKALRDWVRSIKQESGCVKCGVKDSDVLHFHHLDRNKKKNGIARLSSVESIQAEIDGTNGSGGCVIMCANCHIRHERENAVNIAKSSKREAIRDRIRRLELSKILDKIKTSTGCCVCEENDPSVLQFHHLDERLKTMVIGAEKPVDGNVKLMKELETCITLCANCHSKQECHKRRILGRVYGTDHLHKKLSIWESIEHFYWPPT